VKYVSLLLALNPRTVSVAPWVVAVLLLLTVYTAFLCLFVKQVRLVDNRGFA
jgi:hypothetical protein